MNKNAELQAGDKAPEFSAVDETGATRALSDYKGKTVVLYFYPKDSTSGCTAEACDFRDRHAAFKKKGAVVLGVSPDSAKSHASFKEKQGLPFPLLVDEDKSLCQAYGVWKEKSMYGRKYMGVERSTFVIGPDGRIKNVWRKVSVPGHVEAVGQSF
ncbi:MAG: thioredoxin-dependent thiol peroxidase [Elusimicrobia bacterium]|nr:thioredoxin-dependent thiol peroxidase [Elusimicrobiota bacterium]MDE2312724.1 thioredoxin-dependent thiol peroxidase [Elusimicrobiota bacterium]